LDFGKDLYHAVASPRVHHQLLPDVALVEHGFSKDLQKTLRSKKHLVFEIPSNFSVSAVQAVRRLPDGSVEAASDPRKMGLAAAY
jgi:gamma-glutamyltranspeptidase/glutathione hydrolase/leukotriene-C4 hydrolase